jgi:hypothetical protein
VDERLVVCWECFRRGGCVVVRDVSEDSLWEVLWYLYWRPKPRQLL